MLFHKTQLNDCTLIDLTPNNDDRGSFTRTFCEQELKQHGIDFHVAQCNASFNKKRGTLRGLHYQETPKAEAKLVWCVRGAVFDVVVDLRKESPTFRQFATFELSEQRNQILYIPKGCAHGYLTLASDSLLFYWMSEFYDNALARGVRWNDPAFQIPWPKLENICISPKDQSYPDFR